MITKILWKEKKRFKINQTKVIIQKLHENNSGLTVVFCFRANIEIFVI